MAMGETLKRFPEQFDWVPEVVNGDTLKEHTNYILAGMGGSHLGGWLIKKYGGINNLFIHRDYGLPDLPKDILENALIILSSYSGTTEETLDAGRVALERGLALAVVTKGGKLLEFAREHALPHVIIPDTNLEPRMAIGFSMLATACLLKNEKLEEAIRSAGKNVDPMAGKSEGERIGEILKGKIPIIYGSAQNFPLAYIWKIKFNETSKIPAFCNTVPEMCHNELTGFDVVSTTREISARMHALFLDDPADHPRVLVRMNVAAQMLTERGIPMERVALMGDGFAKAFSAALMADWISMELAQKYGVPNPETPMVAEFKKRIGQ